jgi:capsular exopolysaccharide synthesis family protein
VILEQSFALNPITAPSWLIEHPADLVTVLWRGRRWIVGCTLAALVLAAVVLATATRLYQGTAKLLVLQHGARPLSTVSLSAEHAGLVEGAEDYIPTHALILKSPVVVGRALEAIGLNNLPSIDPTIGPQRAVQEIVKNLTVTRPDRNAQILQVDYLARSPEESVRVVRAVAASYKSFLEDVSQKNNSEVVLLMTRAHDDLGKELEELERKYLEFRRQSPLLADSAGRPLINRRIDEWDHAASEARIKALQLKAQLELGRKLAGDGVGLWSIGYALDQVDKGSNGAGGFGAHTQGLLPAPPSDYLRQLGVEQQQLATRLGPQSTRVKELEEQITQVQEQSRATRSRHEQFEINDMLHSIEQTLKSIEAMRTQISEQFDREADLARSAEIALVTESNLKSAVERQRMLFNTVVDQLKQAQFAGDFSGTLSETIEEANALPGPVRPIKSLILALALAAGLIVGLTMALVSDLLDPRIRSQSELRRVVDLPVVGRIPHQREAPEPAGLACHARPRSPVAEAYQVARANLDGAARDRAVRVILVTSPRVGEGRTTVASNLAICLAQAGRRVLLVDADFRRPGQHTLHGLIRSRGLSQVLRDLVPAARVVQTTGVKNLEVITCGGEVANPVELLSAPRLREFLADARTTHDAVIIDAPPLLEVADPALLGALADGILLVLRTAATRRDDAHRALERLKDLGTPILGVIANISGSGPQPVQGQGKHGGWRRWFLRSEGEIVVDPQIVPGRLIAGSPSSGTEENRS